MSDSEISSESGLNTGKQCEMPDCTNTDELKACRDPSDNLLDMCPSCRSAWPVEVLEG